MSIGIQPDKAAIDARLGAAALAVNEALLNVKALKFWLDSKTQSDLTGLGYTTGEYAQIVSALADLDQLRTLYEGSASLASPKDFRTFAKLLYGFGVS